MVTIVDAPTALVLMVNVALVAPAGTLTLEGTLTAVLLLDSVTCAPPAGAGPLNITIPVEDCAPPTTLVGFNVNPLRMASGNGCSKTQTVGFGSLRETTMNFDGETA